MKKVLKEVKSNDGYAAQICLRKNRKHSVEIHIKVKKKSIRKTINDNKIQWLQDLYQGYLQKHAFNFNREKNIASIIRYDPWITINENDIDEILHQIIKIIMLKECI